MSFNYNSSGLRTQKTVNGETKQYFYSGDLLVSEYDGVEYMNFIYSPSGEPVGFSFLYEEDNELLDYYIYLKNLQGDIIGLIDFNGEIYCTYSYDAWGKLTGVYDKHGNEITNPNSPALRNPLRYRGYYYDNETGLYYLKSRYYNPEWGRFVCGDEITAVNDDVLSTNIYAYCFDNPVNLDDQTGYYSGVDDLTAFAVGALTGIGGQLISDALTGSLSSLEIYVGSAIGGGIGGIVSLYCPPAAAAVSSGLSVFLGESLECLTGKSNKTIDNILFDSVLSAGIGAFVDEFSSALTLYNKNSAYTGLKSAYNKGISQLGRKNTNKTISYVYSTIDNGIASGMCESIPYIMLVEVVPNIWNNGIAPMVKALKSM